MVPGPGGVYDYAENLRKAIGASAEIVPISQSFNDSFKQHLKKNLLIQYSGYGYATRGAPLWLLDKVQTDRPHIKTLGVFFHELYAFGSPLKSAFWLSPVQRHIARRLAEMSDFWITNREGSAQWLSRFAGDRPHAVLPIFSNVGEMSAYSPARAPKIIVFGSAGLRMSTYRAAGEALFSWAREQDLEIHDIGPAIEAPVLSAMLRCHGVVQHGRIETEKVSKQLSNAMFGVLAYPVDYVAKSSVFAAHCAHGVCPILVSEHYAPSDGLMTGTHYLAGLPLGAMQHSTVRNIGSAAWDWYQPHQIMAHVNTIQRLLSEAGPKC